ncbi:MAG: hypothetical protein JW839_00610 [Candidatus Lokiarchaeota archaeon]|nr:hypothetical protein [Candidatus Lokiarchaeota archaeon]
MDTCARLSKGRLAIKMAPGCVLLVLVAFTSVIGPKAPALATFPGDAVPGAAGVWWTMELVSSESADHSYNPDVVVDGDGNVHVAWYDQSTYGSSGSDFDIFYKVWNATTSSWLPTEVVSTASTSTSRNPSIGVDGDGNVHVAWEDAAPIGGSGSDWDIMYRCRNATEGIWWSMEVVSAESNSTSFNPDVKVDAAGNVHVAWDDQTNFGSIGTDYDITYKVRNALTNLWSPTSVVSTESEYEAIKPSLDIDGDGNVHVAWYDFSVYGGSGADADIFYKRWNATTTNWSTTEVVSTESGESSYSPSLGVDAEGNVHVAWDDPTGISGAGADFDIFYKCWNASLDAWSTTTVVSEGISADSRSPSLAVDTAGSVHVAWHDDSDYGGSGMDPDIFYRCWNATGGGWAAIEVASTDSLGDSSNPSLAVASDGSLHVAWHEDYDYGSMGTDYDIFYKRNAANVAPALTAPADVTYAHGETLNNIFWVVTDKSYGSTFLTVYRNGSAVVSGSWTSSDIINVVVDGLAVGTYNYTLVVTDGLGGTSQDEVLVTVTNVAPTITTPSDLAYEQGTTGHAIAWNVTDASVGTTSYTVFRNGSDVGSGGWGSGTPIGVNVDSLMLGSYNYTIVAIDGLGGTVSDEVIVRVNPNIWPSIDSPADVYYVHGSPGNTISWNVTDASVGTTSYAVFRNGTEVATGSWVSGTTVPINVDGLAVGTYTFQMNANDGLGGSVQDEVLVTVANVAPTISSPADVSYVHGTTGHAISWIVTDASVGAASYTVYRNGTPVATGPWTPGNPVPISVDGLAVGSYNYTIVADDDLGGSVQDIVIVMVTTATAPPDEPGVPGYLLAALLPFMAMAILLVVARLKRRVSSR